MLNTGNQMKAARALIGMDQDELSKRCKVHINTIRNMEAAGADTIVVRDATLVVVRRALEDAGVKFIGGRGLGVCLRIRPLRPIGRGPRKPGLHAPGLMWRNGTKGWVAYWVASQSCVKLGWPIKSRRIWPPTAGGHPDEPTAANWKQIAKECVTLHDEMTAWTRRGDDP